MRILCLPGSYNSPAARFRVWQFVEPLRGLGHKVTVRVINPDREGLRKTVGPEERRLGGRVGSLARLMSALWLGRDAHTFDVVFMNRDIVPEVRIDFLEPWLARRGAKLVFDFDDAIHLKRRNEKLRKILPLMAAVTPGNEFLAAFARQFNSRVSVLPTVVDTNHYQVASKRAPGPIRVGWSGSRSTLRHCLPILEGILTALAKVEEFEFVVIADSEPEIDWEGVSVRSIPWAPRTEVNGLQQIDIGLMPLRDEPFEQGKCGLKAIQYMAVGTPALVSPVGVNRQIVVDGVSGFHCTKDEEWEDRIRLLLRNDDMRRRMGEAARKRIEKWYSIEGILPRIIEVFEYASGTRVRPGSSMQGRDEDLPSMGR